MTSCLPANRLLAADSLNTATSHGNPATAKCGFFAIGILKSRPKFPH